MTQSNTVVYLFDLKDQIFYSTTESNFKRWYSDRSKEMKLSYQYNIYFKELVSKPVRKSFRDISTLDLSKTPEQIFSELLAIS